MALDYDMMIVWVRGDVVYGILNRIRRPILCHNTRFIIAINSSLNDLPRRCTGLTFCIPVSEYQQLLKCAVARVQSVSTKHRLSSSLNFKIKRRDLSGSFSFNYNL